MTRGVRKDGFPAKILLEQFEEGLWANIIAERLGTNRATVQRWRTGNIILNPYVADRYAIKLGKHPSQIWPEWFNMPDTVTEPEQRKKKRNVRK